MVKTSGQTEVYVNKMRVEQWLRAYCVPDKFCGYCKSCPDYNKRWSCPPGIPATKEYFDCYQEVYTIAVKVLYSKEDRLYSYNLEMAEKLRQATYGKVKRVLYETLLYIEKENPGTLVLGAGRCEQCEVCSRIRGLPCQKPEKMRHSFAAFGFDFQKLVKDIVHQELLWSSSGLPEYNIAVAALLIH